MQIYLPCHFGGLVGHVGHGRSQTLVVQCEAVLTSHHWVSQCCWFLLLETETLEFKYYWQGPGQRAKTLDVQLCAFNPCTGLSHAPQSTRVIWLTAWTHWNWLEGWLDEVRYTIIIIKVHLSKSAPPIQQARWMKLRCVMLLWLCLRPAFDLLLHRLLTK